MNKYIVEFIGTFFLIFTIGNVVMEPGAAEMAPLAIGAVLMVMVFAGGHISGAHYNPAVTIAVFLRGKCEAKDILPYIGAQIVAAVAAAAAVMFIKGAGADKAMEIVIPQAFVAELLFTFALAFVILNVATVRSTEGNAYYGLAIGFTVLAGAYTVGGVSGGVFNPAVAIGISIMGMSDWANIWVYFVANVVGAVLAVGAFKIVNGPEADA